MENKEFDFHEIKTFEDACRRLGIGAGTLLVESYGDTEAFLQADALYKLLIIQKAINNGVWCDENGLEYYPYWTLLSKEKNDSMSKDKKQKRGVKQLLSCDDAIYSGYYSSYYSIVRRNYVYSRSSITSTVYGLSFCFNCEEAARHAAFQFEDLFLQYYGIKVKIPKQ